MASCCTFTIRFWYMSLAKMAYLSVSGSNSSPLVELKRVFFYPSLAGSPRSPTALATSSTSPRPLTLQLHKGRRDTSSLVPHAVDLSPAPTPGVSCCRWGFGPAAMELCSACMGGGKRRWERGEIGVRGRSRVARRGRMGDGRAGEEKHWQSGPRKCSAQLWTKEEDEGEDWWATWDADCVSCATSDDDWSKTGVILLRGSKVSGLDS